MLYLIERQQADCHQLADCVSAWQAQVASWLQICQKAELVLLAQKERLSLL